MLESDPRKRLAKLKVIEEEMAAHGRAVDKWYIHRTKQMRKNDEVLLLILQGRQLAESLLKDLSDANLQISALNILGRSEANEITLLN